MHNTEFMHSGVNHILKLPLKSFENFSIQVEKWKVNPLVACHLRNLVQIDLCKTNLSRSYHAQYRIHAQWGKSLIKITFEIVWNLFKKGKVNPLVACLARNLVRIDLCKPNFRGSCHAQYRIHAQWGKSLIKITFEIVWNLLKKRKVNLWVACLLRNLLPIDLSKQF